MCVEEPKYLLCMVVQSLEQLDGVHGQYCIKAKC